MNENMKQMKFLSVKKRADEIRNRYEARERIDKIRALVYGNTGMGKSRLVLTCPQPVLADSFDPAGFELRALKEMKAQGRLIVDDRWERDDWKAPTVYRDWEKALAERKKDGFFDYIGTYFFDGSTRWAQSMLYEIMRKGGSSGTRAGQIPQLQDYLVQQYTGADVFGSLLDLPCHVIITGLIAKDKDEVTGRMTTGLLLAGKFSAQLPPLFSECYVAQSSGSGKWHLLTQPESTYFAKTRMGEGVFKAHEEPDIKALLRKAGLSDADSPYLEQFLNKGEEKSEL